jgi:hypothetical protein
MCDTYQATIMSLLSPTDSYAYDHVAAYANASVDSVGDWLTVIDDNRPQWQVCVCVQQ